MNVQLINCCFYRSLYEDWMRVPHSSKIYKEYETFRMDSKKNCNFPSILSIVLFTTLSRTSPKALQVGWKVCSSGFFPIVRLSRYSGHHLCKSRPPWVGRLAVFPTAYFFRFFLSTSKSFNVSTEFFSISACPRLLKNWAQRPSARCLSKEVPKFVHTSECSH